MKKHVVLLTVAAGLVAGGCGSGSSAPEVPTVAPARTYKLQGFEPSGKAEAGKPTMISFTIEKPDGTPLTRYRRGSGPHTGVHMILVRDDLSQLIHRHPPVDANGKVSESVVLPEPGRYRVVVDAYPDVDSSIPGTQRNFQLFDWIDVAGPAASKPLPPFEQTVESDGLRFRLEKKPKLKAIEADFLTIDVKDKNGKPAKFTPYFGALAHAIFFREGTLDYFHTHVCAPGASGCTSFLGGAQVAGSSSTPGKLRVGVLVPVAGTWRLFLQSKVNGRVVTAPFTLEVK